MPTGPILVFDMDETLLSTVCEFFPETKELPKHYVIHSVSINMKLLSIIYRAIQLRKKGYVCPILLLTNNDNTICIYKKEIKGFVDIGREEIGKAYTTISSANKGADHVDVQDIFDCIFTAESKYFPPRTRLPMRNDYRKPVKSMHDVKAMLRRCKIKTTGKLDVFFFDDDTTHKLSTEIPSTHYIKIVSPYGEGKDYTNYRPIEDRLSELEGGKRETRKRGRKLKESRQDT